MKVTTDACLFGAWAAEEIKSKNSKVKTLLDIGTGTGLLPLMIAQIIPGAKIDSIEIDKDSFEQAAENIAASPWPGRINIIHADARNFSCEYKYDIIISNPPFYEKELKSEDKKKNIAHHGNDLSLRELLLIIQKYLAADGTFYLLLPYKRNEEIKKLIMKNDLFIQQIVFVKQSARHDNFRIMISGKLNTTKSSETLIDEIVIKDGSDNYTQQFITLLKGYYSSL